LKVLIPKKFGNEFFRSSGCQSLATTGVTVTDATILGLARLPLLDIGSENKPFFIDIITFTDEDCTDVQRVASIQINGGDGGGGGNPNFPSGLSVDETGTINNFYLAGPVCTPGTEGNFFANFEDSPVVSPGYLNTGEKVYICNATQWENFAITASLHDDRADFILFKDIDYTGFVGGNTSVGSSPAFRGTLEGNKFSFIGIDNPLFDTFEDSILRNFTIKNFNLTPSGDNLAPLGRAPFASVAPIQISDITIENGSVVDPSADNVGGLIGSASASAFAFDIRGVKVKNVRIEGKNYVGGIIGNATGTGGPTPNLNLYHASYESTDTNLKYIKGINYVGGIVGASQDIGIYGAFADGKIIINNDDLVPTLCSGSVCNFGGILGGNANVTTAIIGEAYSKMKIENSDNSASGETIDNVGGIVGYLYGGVSFTSFVFRSKYDGPGISLAKTGTVGDVDNVGGLVGYADGDVDISESINFADVVDGSDIGECVGGAVGHLHADAYMSGVSVKDATIRGDSNIGGLVGMLNGNLTNSLVLGITLDPQTSHSGGIAGIADSSTSNVASDIYVELNSIPAVMYSGGLFGEIDTATTNPGGAFILNNLILNYTGAAFAASTGTNLGLLVGCLWQNYFSGPYPGYNNVCHHDGSADTGDKTLRFSTIFGGFANTTTPLTCAGSPPDDFASLSFAPIASCADSTNAAAPLTTFSDTFWVGANSVVSNNLPKLDLKVQNDLHGYAIGTKEDPIIINSADKWQSIGDNNYNLSRVYKLQEDGLGISGVIDFDYLSNPYVSIGTSGNPFLGTIIPNGVSLVNLDIDTPTTTTIDMGLFGVVGQVSPEIRGGQIGSEEDSLIVVNLEINNSGSDGENLGAIAGSFLSGTISAKVIFSSIVADMNTPPSALGGLVGIMGHPSITNDFDRPRITRSVFSGDITTAGVDAYNFVGGLVGEVQIGLLDKTLYNGIISADGSLAVGGIVGHVSDELYMIQTAAKVTIKNENAPGIALGVGGLIGVIDASGGVIVTDSYARVNAILQVGSGFPYLGGLFGYLDNDSTVDVFKSYVFEGSQFFTPGTKHIAHGYLGLSGPAVATYNEVISYNNTSFSVVTGIQQYGNLQDFNEELSRFGELGDIWASGANFGRLLWELQSPITIPFVN